MDAQSDDVKVFLKQVPLLQYVIEKDEQLQESSKNNKQSEVTVENLHPPNPTENIIEGNILSIDQLDASSEANLGSVIALGEDDDNGTIYFDVEDVEVEVDVSSEPSQTFILEEHTDHSAVSNVNESGEKIPIILKKSPKPLRGMNGKYYCRYCFRMFNQLENMVKHERVHTGERPYHCDVCGKAFTQQSNLWKHVRTHTGERPYKCTTCDKAFTQQANLAKHIRTHTGEKPFQCRTCGRSFSQRTNLLKHERIHTGEKPYACNFCSKSFAQQSNMVKHERIHTGVKPYSCRVCSKSFTQQSNWVKHEALHKSDKQFMCERCGKLYTRRSNSSRYNHKCNIHKEATKEVEEIKEFVIKEEPEDAYVTEYTIEISDYEDDNSCDVELNND